MSFEKSVFINCPFDDEYSPILQAILFCVVYLGFEPRSALESQDSAETRIVKILGLIEASRYSIHDLSRSRAKKKGEFYRLNIPFELGLDYGCRHFVKNGQSNKKILILQSIKYQHQIALSDLSGCDLEVHGSDYKTAIRKVRNWLATEAGIAAVGAGLIEGKYLEFQEWIDKKLIGQGFSDADIQDYPTKELLESMKIWVSTVERPQNKLI